MASIGLVLGAGGIVGAAYHAGVLTALAEAGFDARDAEVIVGTSAGASVGASLRAGFPPADLAPRNLGQPISKEAEALVEAAGGSPDLKLRPRPFSRVPLPASPRLLLSAGRVPAKALAGLLPTGTIDNDVIGERISRLYGDTAWPAESLWICAVDLDRGDRVVFGSETSAPIGVAVQASSAIPGFFRPVGHDGRRFIDGGVHSPTNADLTAERDLDLVVIVSPMSATRAGRRTSLPSGRPLHGRRLAREVARIRASGAAVLTFQPTPTDVSVMGRNGMDADRRPAATAQALATARDRIADPAVADRLELLRQASS